MTDESPGRPASGNEAPALKQPHGIEVLHARYARDRGQDDFCRLALHYLALADRLARRFRGSAPPEDLCQVAREALLRALQRFDPHLGVAFTTFAAVTIEGTLKRHLRDTRGQLRIPRSSHDLSFQLRRAAELLEQELRRPPTIAELAAWLGVEARDVRDALQAQRSRDVQPLESGEPGDDGGMPVAAVDRDLQRAEDRCAVAQAMAAIPPRERELLWLYFGQGRSQSEIAAATGVSQMQVSRRLHRALERLRPELLPA
jgi:RNA polymerase sigma-B factor